MSYSKEYQALAIEHLALLTSHGRNYIATIESAFTLLQSDQLGEIQLSAEEKNEYFKILGNTLKKHRELIEWSIGERQKLISDTNRTKEGSSDTA
jgi:hypothetical protein